MSGRWRGLRRTARALRRRWDASGRCELKQGEGAMPAWWHEEVLPPGRVDKALQPVGFQLALCGWLHQIKCCLVAPHRCEEIRGWKEAAKLELGLNGPVRYVHRVKARPIHTDMHRCTVWRTRGALQGRQVAND